MSKCECCEVLDRGEMAIATVILMDEEFEYEEENKLKDDYLNATISRKVESDYYFSIIMIVEDDGTEHFRYLATCDNDKFVRDGFCDWKFCPVCGRKLNKPKNHK